MCVDEGTFLLGVAQEKISPELPCCLAGYFHKREATSIRDDLFVKVIVAGQLVLVSCDLVALPEDIVHGAKKLICEKLDLKPEQILICATHTHTGPEIRRKVHNEWCDDNYIQQLIKTIAATVGKALEARFQGTIHYGSIDAPGYSFNRLYRNSDGSEVFGRNADNIIGPAGPVDSSVQTLMLRDADKNVRAFAVNFACHPDIVGGGRADFVSADWPGEMAKNIAAVYGEDVPCLFLQGTAGDINQSDYQEHYMPNGGPLKTVQLGRAIAGAAMLAGEKAEPLSDRTTTPLCERIEIPCFTRDEKFMRKIAELKEKTERTYFENALVERAEAWQNDGKSVKAPIHCMRLGNIAVVGLPAEIFTGLGLEIKKYSPAEHTIIIELANERVSNYIPTTDQANRGAYGAIPILSRLLDADAGRLIVERAIMNLHKLWNN